MLIYYFINLIKIRKKMTCNRIKHLTFLKWRGYITRRPLWKANRFVYLVLLRWLSRWQWGIPRRELTHHPRPRGGKISPSPSPPRPLGNIFLPSPFPAENWSPMGIPVPDTKQDKDNRTISMSKT